MSMIKCPFCPTWHPGPDENYFHGCEGKDKQIEKLKKQLSAARARLAVSERKVDALQEARNPQDMAEALEARLAREEQRRDR